MCISSSMCEWVSEWQGHLENCEGPEENKRGAKGFFLKDFEITTYSRSLSGSTSSFWDMTILNIYLVMINLCPKSILDFVFPEDRTQTKRRQIKDSLMEKYLIFHCLQPWEEHREESYRPKVNTADLHFELSIQGMHPKSKNVCGFCFSV